MSDLQQVLMPVFLEEATETLDGILGYFKSYRHHPHGDREALETACRSAHTLKGASGLVHLGRVHDLAEELELGLTKVAESGRPLTRQNGNALLARFKELAAIVKEIQSSHLAADTVTDQTEPPPSPSPSPQSPTELSPAPVPPEESPSITEQPAEGDSTDREAIPENVCCRFRTGQQDYYLPIEQMAEISLIQEITPLPLAPPHIKGIMNLRGEVVPVADLASLHDTRHNPQARRHMVVSLAKGEKLAFLTDELPTLSPEFHGERIDIRDFIDRYGVKKA